jgi:hypothetical protein
MKHQQPSYVRTEDPLPENRQGHTITEPIKGAFGGNGKQEEITPRFKQGHSLAWYAQQPIDEQQTLLGNRYLCRSGGMFVVAPSGNFQNTDKYSLWDWAYHGAGAACITNWARAILAIKPETDNMTVFRFIAAKRGKRIGEEWENEFERFFAWSSIPGVLRWETATKDQIDSSGKGKASKNADLEVALEQVPVVDPGLKATVLSKIRAACKVGEKLASAALDELIISEKVIEIPIKNPNRGRSLVGVVRSRT